MTRKVHTIESAPAESKSGLEAVKKGYGFVPNLIGVMAEAPIAMQAYLAQTDLLGKSSLTPVEQQVLMLAISYGEHLRLLHGGSQHGSGRGEDADARTDRAQIGRASSRCQAGGAAIICSRSRARTRSAGPDPASRHPQNSCAAHGNQVYNPTRTKIFHSSFLGPASYSLGGYVHV